MRFRITLLLLGSLFVACDDSPSGPSDPLAGTYDWVQSTGGFAGQTRSPETEGYMVRLELDGRGHARVITNGIFAAAGNYSVTELPTMGMLPTYALVWSPPLPAFFFATFDRQTLTLPQPGLLLFTDPCCDGWAHTFVAIDAP